MRRTKRPDGRVGSAAGQSLAVAAFRPELPRLAARSRAILDPNIGARPLFLKEHEAELECVVPERSMMLFPASEPGGQRAPPRPSAPARNLDRPGKYFRGGRDTSGWASRSGRRTWREGWRSGAGAAGGVTGDLARERQLARRSEMERSA